MNKPMAGILLSGALALAAASTCRADGFATAPEILTSPVPEPSEFALMLAGLGSVG